MGLQRKRKVSVILDQTCMLSSGGDPVTLRFDIGRCRVRMHVGKVAPSVLQAGSSICTAMVNSSNHTVQIE